MDKLNVLDLEGSLLNMTNHAIGLTKLLRIAYDQERDMMDERYRLRAALQSPKRRTGSCRQWPLSHLGRTITGRRD